MYLSLRCLGYTILLVQGLISLLLIYALIIEGGNVVVDGCKQIGFYNYCFRNATDGDGCHCITQFADLHSTGETFPHGLALSLILTYSSLVIVFMGLITLALAQCLKDGVLWNFELGLNVLSLVGLFLGITTYLFLTWRQFDLSHVTLGFLALLMAVVGLCLQSGFVAHYIRLNNVLLTTKSGGHNAGDLSILVA